ncbi:hypothetical protein HFN72_33665 [Rhizobium laguerreae]|uniref:hypothetical protein n=1 Tax=Rhizobium laguerreae TaxID=1076926 RepID=UPI001C9218CC|nr:hypothetical protein [Rhizobium laguerreae]MBY3530816.1 hypothetical protein [Rhizobium laguerreae]
MLIKFSGRAKFARAAQKSPALSQSHLGIWLFHEDDEHQPVQWRSWSLAGQQGVPEAPTDVDAVIDGQGSSPKRWLLNIAVGVKLAVQKAFVL